MEYLIVLLLVTLSGVFSGLTIGLFSLDLSGIERQMELGNPLAKRVYPIRKRGNLLLCTLLLGNVAVNSALSIFLGTIASGVLAGLVATSLIVIFGEILPAAVFTKYALKVGATSVPLVRLFMFTLMPISYPLSAALDKFVGGELPTVWGKSELKLILREHEKATDSEVDEDDARIAIGALTYSDLSVMQRMTPLDMLCGVSEATVVDCEQVERLLRSERSSFPVVDADGVGIGLFDLRDLVGYDSNVGSTVRELGVRKAPTFDDESPLDEVLKVLVAQGAKKGLVARDHKLVGLISVEDVFESILQRELDD